MNNHRKSNRLGTILNNRSFDWWVTETR